MDISDLMLQSPTKSIRKMVRGTIPRLRYEIAVPTDEKH